MESFILSHLLYLQSFENRNGFAKDHEELSQWLVDFFYYVPSFQL